VWINRPIDRFNGNPGSGLSGIAWRALRIPLLHRFTTSLLSLSHSFKARTAAAPVTDEEEEEADAMIPITPTPPAAPAAAAAASLLLLGYVRPPPPANASSVVESLLWLSVAPAALLAPCEAPIGSSGRVCEPA